MKSFFLLLVLIPLSLQIDHCLIEKSVCKKCKTGYSLSEGKCVKIEHCRSYSSDQTTCLSCQDGYKLNDDKTLCITYGEDHCNTYTTVEGGTTKICNECQPGYKLKEDNTCELVVEHCVESELSGNDLICYECEKDYALNEANNKCIAFPKCIEVDEDDKCIKCEHDSDSGIEYIHANQEGKCVFDICKEYNDDWKCKKCENYFYLNDEGQCKYIEIPYCKKLEKNNKNECDDTAYFLKGHDPEDYLTAKEEYLTRCQYKDNNGKCTICENGYEVDSNGNCVFIGCEELEEPSSKCEFCENGYILVDYQTRCMPVSEVSRELGKEDSKDSRAVLINSIYKLNILLFLYLLFLL